MTNPVTVRTLNIDFMCLIMLECSIGFKGKLECSFSRFIKLVFDYFRMMGKRYLLGIGKFKLIPLNRINIKSND